MRVLRTRRQARRARRQQGGRRARPRPTPRRCGTSASASRSRSRRCTAGAAATCSTRSRGAARARRRRRREPAGPRRVALVGRPNVGKSSLLNKLAGEERVVVDAVAGTTRDPVDEMVELGGREWRFVDTAGIRRRVHQVPGADYYAGLRTQAAHREGRGRRRALDAERAAGRAGRTHHRRWSSRRAGRSCSRSTSGTCSTRTAAASSSARSSGTSCPCRWAPRVNISAQTGRHLEKLVPALDAALDGWETRDPDRRGSTRSSARSSPRTRRRCAAASSRGSCSPPRRRPGRRASCSSPSGFLEAGYRRFIERRLREEFGFDRHARSRSRVRVREKRSADGADPGGRGRLR